MAKFERIKTRVNLLGQAHTDECWRVGYQFESNDYNGIEGLGFTYALDTNGNRHMWEAIKRIDE